MSANSSKEPIQIKIELPTNTCFMPGVRELTSAMVKNMTSFPKKWKHRLQSITDELCTNAIEHGSNQDDKIYLTFVKHPNQDIQIIVEDNGSNPNAKNAQQIKQDLINNNQKETQTLGLRGRGLTMIVKKWADQVDIEDRLNGGIKITATKFFQNIQ